MSEFSGEIEKCITHLTQNEVILYPTDTIWGLGGDSTSPIAIRKIYEIKKRSDSKSLVSLVSSLRMLENITSVSQKIKDILSESTKPTTVIYSDVKLIHSLAKAEDGSAAIRIVNDPFCKALIETLGKPLLSTSANISGTPSPLSFSDIPNNLVNSCDYTVSYRKDEPSNSAASRILKIEEDEIIVIRE